MKSYKVRDTSGQEFDVDENKIHEAEKDGFLPVVSNGKDFHRVSFGDLSLAEKDGFKPLMSSDVSPMESFVRNAGQSASFGFADEITAGIESALTDKSYDKALAESRANYKEAEEANPLSSIAGGITGAVGTAFIPGVGALNAGKAATFAGRLGLAAAQGGLTGLGTSEEDNALGLAKDSLKGAAIGAAAQGVGEKVLAPAAKYVGNKLSSLGDKIDDGVEWGLKKGGKTLANIPEEYTGKYLNNPDEINNALSREELADLLYKKSYLDNGIKLDPNKLPPSLHKYIPERDPGLLQQLRQAVSERDSDAWRVLPKDFKLSKTDMLDDALFSIEDDILKNGIDDSGITLANGVGGHKQELDAVHAALDEIKAATSSDDITLRDLKRVVQGIRKKAYSEAGSARSGNSANGLTRVADFIDQYYLKGNSPEYRKAMEPVAEATRLEGYLNNKLVDSANSDNYDKFYSQLNRWKNSGDEKMFKKAIGNLDTELNSNFSDQIDNTLAKEAFTKSDTQGSRKTLLGTVVGGGAGSLFGGPVGGVFGGMIGGVAGQVGDRYAGSVFKSILNGKIAADKGLEYLAPKLGKYTAPLMEAAKRGNQSLAATHFILQQTDPNYRKLMSDKEE